MEFHSKFYECGFAETEEANATYGLYMEMAKSGVMKKSAMDVNIMGKDTLQKILSVSLQLHVPGSVFTFKYLGGYSHTILSFSLNNDNIHTLCFAMEIHILQCTSNC